MTVSPPDWVTLRIFLAAVQLGSITRAAERCGIATSAAAKRVQEFEAAYGVRLLDRGARGVRPTPAGEALVRHARALLDFASRLQDDLHAFAEGGFGSVRLHATASVLAGHGLAQILADFARVHGGIQVELREDKSLPILQELLEGRADLGIVTTAARVPAALEAQFWREDNLVAVVPVDHPLATRRSISYGEILDHPLVAVQEGGALSLLLEEAAQRLGRQAFYRCRVTSLDAAWRLVSAGHGITVAPEGMIRLYEPVFGLRGIPLDEDWARRRLRIVSRPPSALPPPARLLLEHLLQTKLEHAAERPPMEDATSSNH